MTFVGCTHGCRKCDILRYRDPRYNPPEVSGLMTDALEHYRKVTGKEYAGGHVPLKKEKDEEDV